MTETWANESALEHAREILAERFPGETIEILECFDIAHIGWECDFEGALITRDGMPEIVIVDETGGDERSVAVRLRERIDEYRRLIVETERVLTRQQELLLAYVKAGLGEAGPRTPEEARRRFDAAVKAIAPYFGSAEADEGARNVLRGIPPDPMPAEIADAIEEQVAERMQQLADAPGGRIAIDVGDLTPEELELLADSEIPEHLRWDSMDPLREAAADFVARMAAAGYSADDIGQAVALPIFGLTTDELTSHKKEDDDE